MEEMNKVNEAYEFIKDKIGYKLDIAVILGSGLGDLANEVSDKIEIKYADIPHFPVSTVKGHAGKFVCGNLEGKKVIMMQGRFHYYEGYDMKAVTFPIRVMKKLGIDKLIVTNAAGGVNTSFKPGDLMLIKDHINLAFNNPLIGKNIDEMGPRFPDMSEAYNRELIEIAEKASKKVNVNIVKGVYCMMTPAEIKMVRYMGADAVGMSTVPEVIAAGHCKMKTLGISCITNMACGILERPLNHNEVIETSNMVKDKFTSLVKQIIKDC